MTLARQRGMAILTVLLIVTAITVLATATTGYWQQQYQQSLRTRTEQQLYWTLMSTEALIRRQLPSLPVVPPGVQSMQTDETAVQWRVRDDQACFNLNALLPGGQREESGEYFMPYARRIFVHLLMTAGVAKEAAPGVMEAMLAPIKAAPDGVVTQAYADVSQARVAALPADSWRRLVRQLCVLPDTRLQINLNGLEPHHAPLLAALFVGEMDTPVAERLIRERPARGWASPEALGAHLDKGMSQGVFSSMLTVTDIRTRHYTLFVRVAQTPGITVQSQLYADKNMFRTAARRQGLNDEVIDAFYSE